MYLQLQKVLLIILASISMVAAAWVAAIQKQPLFCARRHELFSFNSNNNGWDDASQHDPFSPPQYYRDAQPDFDSFDEEQYYNYNHQPPFEGTNPWDPPHYSNGDNQYASGRGPPVDPTEQYRYHHDQPQHGYFDGQQDYYMRQPLAAENENSSANHDPRNRQGPPPMEGYSLPENTNNPDHYQVAPMSGRRHDSMMHKRTSPYLDRSPWDLFGDYMEDSRSMFDRFGMPFGSLSRPFSPLDAPWSDDIHSRMRDQQQEITSTFEPVLNDAERYLNEDMACIEALGSPIQMGPVFSQSSSVSSFNDQTSRLNTHLGVGVQGSHQGGMLRLQASEVGVEQMILEYQDENNGEYRELNVWLPHGGARVMSGANDTGIINADIVEEN